MKLLKQKFSPREENSQKRNTFPNREDDAHPMQCMARTFFLDLACLGRVVTKRGASITVAGQREVFHLDFLKEQKILNEQPVESL